jgi:hypothetical protein
VVVVLGASPDVVVAAVVVEVEEVEATVPVPLVPGSAMPLPHDARNKLATAAVAQIPLFMDPWFHWDGDSTRYL